MDSRLPLFPLGTVLFPGLVLPLHIFEQRYRRLVRHLLELPDGTPREFGVVAIRRGWTGPVTASGRAGTATGPDPSGLPAESGVQLDRPAEHAAGHTPAGSAVTLYEIGCTAQVRQITELTDGRFDLVTVGARRFRIAELDERSAPYLTADVQWLSEPPGQEEAADQLAPRVIALLRQYLELIRSGPQVIAEQLPEDPTVLSHLVAATTALSLPDRQSLLAVPDTATRLRTELRLLSREVALLRQVRAVPVPLPEVAVPASPN